MPDHIVSLDAILAARPIVAAHAHRTPMLSSRTAARILEIAGGPKVADGRIHVKAENVQATGSFKARGMTNKCASLTEDERRRGIVTLSAGNAAQAYAWAGREAGVHATVVMPLAAVRSKVDACLGYGAEVVLHGAHVAFE
ncbi:MAG: pyridoxal-phosphate dependent enzyme, partial [Thermoplasmata archaeon]|nr:pyridoxal-phosphate dependent enzyme [Thermoplasmata archaeon]